MAERTQEHRLQAAARRLGLKMVMDRYSVCATGRNRYFLRPIWDARRAVRALPGGGRKLVRITEGRRDAASLLLIEEVEDLLTRWSDTRPFTHAGLVWHTGVATENHGIDGSSPLPS
jgi:hypothetical protein